MQQTYSKPAAYFDKANMNVQKIAHVVTNDEETAKIIEILHALYYSDINEDFSDDFNI